MDLTYREKRIWISLGTQLFVYAVYFYELWRGNVTIGSLLVVIVAIIVLQVVLQIVLALTDRPYPKDGATSPLSAAPIVTPTSSLRARSSAASRCSRSTP